MGKVGGRNFGEFMVIRQICQRFPPPKFPSMWYQCGGQESEQFPKHKLLDSSADQGSVQL